MLQSMVLQRVRHDWAIEQQPQSSEWAWLQDRGFNTSEDEGRDIPLSWGRGHQVLRPEETGRHVLRGNTGVAVLRSRTPNQGLSA